MTIQEAVTATLWLDALRRKAFAQVSSRSDTPSDTSTSSTWKASMAGVNGEASGANLGSKLPRGSRRVKRALLPSRVTPGEQPCRRPWACAGFSRCWWCS